LGAHHQAGAKQWTPKNAADVQIVPDAHLPGVTHAPMMFTTDIAVKEDPAFRAIALKFRKDPQALPMPLPAPGSS
jgi:catalase-peroxidase